MTESADGRNDSQDIGFHWACYCCHATRWICANHLGGYLNAAFLGCRIHGIFHGSHYVYPSQAQWYVPFASISNFRCQDKNTIPGFAQMFKNDVLDWKT
jgi:hypothetical protein